MIGYKFDTIERAEKAVSDCDKYYGIPVAPDDVTQHWAEYQTAEFNQPVFWYMAFDESLLPILGEPTEFEVVQPTPFEDATN
jgi:hypothetical protein